MWQDYVFTIGAIVFSIALIPTILSQDKPPLLTTVPTALILYIFGACFLTLHLWFSAISEIILGTLWGTVAIQKALQNRARKGSTS